MAITSGGVKMATTESKVTCKCVKCTYDEPIKMRPTTDGFYMAFCPRCGTDYLEVKEDEDMTENTRFCEICGEPITAGMTNDYGDFYCCENCFTEYMNRTYGAGKWMSLGNGEQDGCGGFYITTADVVGGYEGTGIYYTEWED